MDLFFKKEKLFLWKFSNSEKKLFSLVASKYNIMPTVVQGNPGSLPPQRQMT